jgi:peptidylprolyl isomerase
MPAVLNRVGLILLVCAGLLVAGCGGDDSDDSTSGDSTATTTEAAATVSKSAAKREKPKVKPPKGAPPKQLVEKTLIPGTGAEAKKGDQVTVNYVGVGYKTGIEFDASFDRGEPFSFTLGNGEVIRGWDLGVEGMKVGERRELIIPPNLAYGSEGSGVIGPNATLVFVIDLIEVS